jgi:hypothetical protein
MRQDETALVREAVRQAEATLARGGRLLPAAYMLVRRNPQTGAPLTHPTAIGSAVETAFAKREDYLAFVGTLRVEAKRLDAIAVALGGEAQAEVEAKDGRISLRRVFYLRVEDSDGVHYLHAVIERSAQGAEKLGPLLDSGESSDDLPEPLLARTT